MAVAPRARPADYFSPDEWTMLTHRSSWRGLWLVAHCWLVIGVAMTIGTLWPVTIPLVVLVIGCRQLGLFVLMHDAAHANLHPSRRVNDRVASWLCSHSLAAYRPYHLQHHRYVQQAEDPDLVLSAPFPVSRVSMRRKALRDLGGRTFYKQRIELLLRAPRRRAADDGDRSPIGRELASGGRFVIGNALGFAVFAACGLWWVWLTMWLLPMVTWLPWISRVRNIAEHALIAQDEADPLRQARTTHAGWLERLLVAPYWVNFHAEHHLFTQVPCWNLPKAHALLAARGVTRHMEVQTGYRRVLRHATRPAVGVDVRVSG